MRLLPLLVVALLLTACEGSSGLAGPEGGSLAAHYFTAIVQSNRIASVVLPVEAGTVNFPPSMTCYLREHEGTVWLVVGTELNVIGCVIVIVGERLHAQIQGGPLGWQALFVAIY